jgi:protein TonB
MMVRASTWLVSAALHGALVWYVLYGHDFAAYAVGSGADDFVIEQGIPIESVALLGRNAETIRAVETDALEMSEARPEIEEVKAEEPIEARDVITSEKGPEQEELSWEIDESMKQETAMAAVEQLSERPVEERLAVGSVKSGGDASELSAFNGRVAAHISRKARPPARGTCEARVKIRFVLDMSGEVLSREIAESSGSSIADEAALRSIDRAAPFPVIPENVSQRPMTFILPLTWRDIVCREGAKVSGKDR